MQLMENELRIFTDKISEFFLPQINDIVCIGSNLRLILLIVIIHTNPVQVFQSE